MKTTRHNVLYVEDDENDRVLLEIACRQANLPVRLQTVTNGQAALDYLRGYGVYADRERHPAPDLILLDLNMPRQCGLEVLEWIRSQPDLRALPVIVLTSSEQKQDIHGALALGVKAYVIKPLDSQRLVEILRQIYAQWLGP